ncbi:SEC14-like protein 2 [Caerostris extrusa]|uniref:SEC14-like protein 2 n=1 Tax=Caerostris extrusa TaxID=172846 RepID=A0AAV4WGM8_CAEEX|nr:SEC14-like protein 2 [Caerostris extrusa]
MPWPENITAEESKVVEELKWRMTKELSPKLLEDETVFYRFCKARDFKLEDAETMLRKHIAWRKEWKVDTICEDYKQKEVLKYAASSFVGFDKEGCLIRYYDFGRSDPKAIIRLLKYGLSDACTSFILIRSLYRSYLLHYSSLVTIPQIAQVFRVCARIVVAFFKSIKMKELIKFGIQIVEQDNERLKKQSAKLLSIKIAVPDIQS